MSETLKIIESITIDLSVEQVWDKTANDFGNVAQWNASLNGVKFDAGQAAGEGQQRVCISPFGETREKMVVYDTDQYVFAYQVEGLPPFVERGVNTWTMRPLDDRRVTMQWEMEIRIAEGVDPEMVTGFKGQMGQLLAEGQEELKHWLETGNPHPRKVAATAQ